MCKEIESFDKEIDEMKKENIELIKIIAESQKEIEKNNKQYVDNAKKKSEKYHIVRSLNFELKLQSKPKNQFIIQSMPNVITVKSSTVKVKGLETVPNKEDIPFILKQEEEPKIELVND